MCNVKACVHTPGNPALTTKYWRSCEYPDTAAPTTRGEAFSYTMIRLRDARDTVHEVFSVSRRPLQAQEGCLRPCCCSTTPTALRGCGSAVVRSHVVGERELIKVKNIPRSRSQILYIQTDRTEYDGAARSGKHLAARVPGWYRFWYRGAATTISSRLFPPLLLRVQTPPKLSSILHYRQGFGVSHTIY